MTADSRQRAAEVQRGTARAAVLGVSDGLMTNVSLILGVSAERVARVIVRSAEDGRYRRIVPFLAAAYMRFKELCPRAAHFLMRRVSGMMEPRP